MDQRPHLSGRHVARLAHRPTRPADWPGHPVRPRGLLFLSPGLALVIYGLSQASGHNGFAAASAIVPLALGITLVAAFAAHVLRRTDGPLINLRVFRVRWYTASTAVFFFAGLSLYGPLLLLSLYYQQIQHHTVLATGLLLAPQGLGSLLPRTTVGTLTDKIGPRLIVIAGLLLTALGTIPFTRAAADTNQWILAGALFVRGAGLASATPRTRRRQPSPSTPPSGAPSPSASYRSAWPSSSPTTRPRKSPNRCRTLTITRLRKGPGTRHRTEIVFPDRLDGHFATTATPVRASPSSARPRRAHEVDIAPPQCEQLTRSQPRERRGREDRPVLLRHGGRDQCPHLLGREQPGCLHSLASGASRLAPGDSLAAPNGRTALTRRSDGDLRAYRKHQTVPRNTPEPRKPRFTGRKQCRRWGSNPRPSD